MGKHEQIARRVAAWERREGARHHPCYEEYFRLFNEQRYYEAHDVLEHIWLGSRGELHSFYKALIQLAGAFVHLELQHRHPAHRVHGRRLEPARRLLVRSADLLEPLPACYEGVSPGEIRELALQFAGLLASGGSARNPWTPAHAPRLALPA
jgi:predicted metal-dependent hydrolase